MKKQKFFSLLAWLLFGVGLSSCYSEKYRYEHRLETPYPNQELLWQQAQQCSANKENCFRGADGLHANLLADYTFFNMEFGKSNEEKSSKETDCQLFEFAKVVLAAKKPLSPNSLKQSYQQLYPGTVLVSEGPGKGTTTLFPQCTATSQ